MSYPTDPKFKKKDIPLDSIRWDNNAINITITASYHRANLHLKLK